MRSIARWFCFTLLGLTWLYPRAQGSYHLLRTPQAGLLPLADELSLDHFRPAPDDSIDWVASHYERLLLESHHLGFRLLQPDLTTWFQRQASRTVQTRSNCGLAHYGSGSMGGYHTYSEILAELDSMHSLFPHLITAPYSIGQSFEGQDIWAVKLSDHPQQNQSSSEARVYFDALTHAREPLGMETLLYFLWWLLENYGQDATATYLLDQREIFAVPVVNPDGYLYNEQIAPQGGGLWRKNRRPHSNTCVGVDLNRNFSNGWGLGVGASTDSCSDTYQGSAAFSEPEVQAVRQMIDSLGAASGFSLHSFGPSFLQPLGYQLQGSDHALYAELASEFVPSQSRGYGIPEHMLNYLIAGSTMDYLYAKNTLGWSPEIGSMFWEPASSICGLVQEMLFPMQYLCWIAGAYARIHDVGFSPAMQTDTLRLSFRLVNRGLNDTAKQVQLKAHSLSPHLTAIDSISSTADIPARQTRAWSTFPLRFFVGSGANPDQPMGIALQVFQDGVLTDSDTVHYLGGLVNPVFHEDFESGLEHWVQSGNTQLWDTTRIDQYGGQTSLTDSPAGHLAPVGKSILVLDSVISVPFTGQTILQYASKWSLGQARVEVQVSQDLQPYTSQPGLKSLSPNNQPFWTGHHHWTREMVDLSAFRGQSIQLRWVISNVGLYPADGLYLDDISINNFKAIPIGLEAETLRSPFRLLAADGQWPVFLALEQGTYEDLELAYYLPNGQEILRQPLPVNANASRFSLPEITVQGALLMVLRENGQVLGSRWLWFQP